MLDTYAERLARQMIEAKRLIGFRDAGQAIEDFDIRGDLYNTAMELAPEARNADIAAMQDWLRLQGDEHVMDLAAGSGFLTRHLREWTSGDVIAVDPSQVQLDYLHRALHGRVRAINGSPDDPMRMACIPDASMDVITSFGGLHHVVDQGMMMREVARMLKPGGRFVAADVGDGTALSRHFDQVTAAKSLTGHSATWLSEKPLDAFLKGLPLKLIRAESVPLRWVFRSEREMALFFKGVHAYDLPEEEILADLKDVLGYEERGGKIHLSWGMFFFEVECA